MTATFKNLDTFKININMFGCQCSLAKPGTTLVKRDVVIVVFALGTSIAGKAEMYTMTC